MTTGEATGLGGSRQLALRASELGADLRELFEADDAALDALFVLGRVAAEFFELNSTGYIQQEVPDTLMRAVAGVLALAENVRDSLNRSRDNLLTSMDALAAQVATLAGVTEEVLLNARDFPGYTVEEKRRLSDLLAEASATSSRLRVSGQLKGLVDEAREASETIRHHSTEIGENELWSFFTAYARSEKISAEVLRALCGATLVTIAVLATVILFHQDASDRSTGEQLGRLSVTVPLGLLAAYLARESGQHRLAAGWARQIAVQLRTIRLYLAELPAAERDRVQVDFAKRIFGSAVGPPANGMVDPDVTGLLEKVTDLVRATKEDATSAAKSLSTAERTS